MSLVLIAVAGWFVAAAVVGLFIWGLARAAASGDRDQLAQVAWAQAVEADGQWEDRRAGVQDRRVFTRPWADQAPGRRSEDVLRRELADAQRALADAETRLEEAEARRTA